MSKIFLNVPNKPYIGTPVNAPMQLCKPISDEPNAVGFTIQWITYGAGSVNPKVSVECNMQQSGNTVQLDQIKSVYIDNTGVNVPVYIYFPSTNFTVPAQPNAASWYPVLTNDLRAFIIAEGFTNGSVTPALGSGPITTTVFFSNILMQPYVANELPRVASLMRSSPDAGVVYPLFNALYDVPSLGDKQRLISMDLSAGSSQSVFGAALPGFFTITSMFASLAYYSDPAAILMTVQCDNGVLGQAFMEAQFVITGVLQSGNIILYQRDALQLRLDASINWVIRPIYQSGLPPVSGLFKFYINYTWTPSA